MDEIALRPIDLVTIGLVVIVIFMLIRMMVLGRRLKKLRKSYVEFMGTTGVQDLEQVIIGLKDRLSHQEEKAAQMKQAIDSIAQTLRSKKGNVGIHRYNAFSERGSDLSFSLAIVDEHEDGLVLSGLHSREHTFVYAKPVKQGQSDYQLTPEEKHAINLALRQGS
jgi:hypothetical protein